MAAPALPVELSAGGRILASGSVSGSPSGYVLVDGAASAGSKHLLGSSDALVEQVKYTLPANCVGVDVWVEVGQGKHGFSGLVVIDPGTDYLASLDLNSINGASIPVMPNERQIINAAPGRTIAALYVLGVPLVGATASSVSGRIYIRARTTA